MNRPLRRGGGALVFLLLIAVVAAPAHAQSAADALVGCYAAAPGGKLWFRIDRRDGRLGYDIGDNRRRPLVPSSRGDLDWMADELGLDRFPGVTIVAGLTEKGEDLVFVRLSSPLTHQGRSVSHAVMAYEFGPDPLFPVNCP